MILESLPDSGTIVEGRCLRSAAGRFGTASRRFGAVARRCGAATRGNTGEGRALAANLPKD